MKLKGVNTAKVTFKVYPHKYNECVATFKRKGNVDRHKLVIQEGVEFSYEKHGKKFQYSKDVLFKLSKPNKP